MEHGLSGSVCDQCGASYVADASQPEPSEGTPAVVCAGCGAELKPRGAPDTADESGRDGATEAAPGVETTTVDADQAATEKQTETSSETRTDPAGDSKVGLAEAEAPASDAASLDSSTESPASDAAITVRAPDVEDAKAPSEDAGLASERDSAIPVESQDFVRDDAPRQRRLPRAPIRPQAPKADTEWLDELPMSVGTPTLAALVQRANTESEKPAAPSIPPELLADRAFDLGSNDWDGRLMPMLRKPTTDAPVVNPSAPPKAAPSNGRSRVVVAMAAIAAAAFAAGLSVRHSAPAPSANRTPPRAVEPAAPNVQAAKPAAAPPEFAIEPAAPEQSPAALPLAEGAPKDSAASPGPVAKSRPPVDNTASAPAATATTNAPAAAGIAPSPTAGVVASTAKSDSLAQATSAAPQPPVEKAAAAAAAVPAQAPLEPTFDTRAAEAAINAAATRAVSCKQPGDPSGVAVVTITFSPSGRATTANVAGLPFAGTPTGGCIAATLRAARVPAFSGDFVTVKKSVKLD